MNLYLAKSRQDNRIYPMTESTLLNALKSQGSPVPHDDLELIKAGRTVRRKGYSFKLVNKVD